MKQTLPILFLLASVAFTQNVGVFYSAAHLAKDDLVAQVVDTSKLQLPLADLSRDTVTISALKAEIFTFARGTPKSTWDPTHLTLQTVGGVFTLNISFHYIDKRSFPGRTKEGDGFGLLTSGDLVLNKVYASDSKTLHPHLTASLSTNLGSFGTVSITQGDDEAKNKVAALLGDKLRESLEVYLNNTIQAQVQAVLDDYNNNFKTSFDYTFNGNQVEVHFGLLSLQPDDNGLIYLHEGTITEVKSPPGELPKFDPVLGNVQFAMTRQFISNLYLGGLLLNYYNGDFHRGDIDIEGWDFVAGDLFYLIPDLKKKVKPDVQTFLSCSTESAKEAKLDFDTTNQRIAVLTNYKCALNTEKDKTLIVNFNVDALYTVDVNLPARDTGIRVNLEVARVSAVKAQDVSVPPANEKVLVAIAQDFIGRAVSKPVWGNGFPLFNLVNPLMTFGDGYILVTGDDVKNQDLSFISIKKQSTCSL
eukprot:TRINITY_DN349_c0_g1_i2.p1 TRINITY_DN349_c0_g1~~TRINITY_DN349_c0_g1_i2.p1  ORF type:complete len:474 (-),score=158.19 TRINITY_DN349_c0_g1_i2:181-1602(-)